MSSSRDSQGRKGKGAPNYSLENLEETADQAQSAHQQDTTEKSRGKRKSKSKEDLSGSDTETEAPKMSSRSSKTSSQSESTKKHGSSSRHRAPQNEDWTEVTDPEERRRIQNRIAQRKFRGKAKEQREKNERDQRNMEHAGDSYRVPEAGEVTTEVQAALSGLPWGGLNMQYAMGRGPEGGYGSGGHGGGASHPASDPIYTDSTHYLSPYTTSYPYTGSTGWDDQTGSSPGGEQLYYDNSTTSYYYDYDTSPRQ